MSWSDTVCKFRTEGPAVCHIYQLGKKSFDQMKTPKNCVLIDIAAALA